MMMKEGEVCVNVPAIREPAPVTMATSPVKSNAFGSGIACIASRSVGFGNERYGESI